jgi:Na+/H+-translocating membrane pyrophosphatase
VQRNEKGTEGQARGKAKREVVEEVRRFAKDRDDLFERTRTNPTSYLKVLFTRAGASVVKEMMVEAEKAGKAHAERLQQTNNRSAVV